MFKIVIIKTLWICNWENLRPIHKTKGIDLIGTGDQPRIVQEQLLVIRRQVIYSHFLIQKRLFQNNPFATTVERVTPFLTPHGQVKLYLIQTKTLGLRQRLHRELVINREGNFDAVVAANRNQLGTVWNSYQRHGVVEFRRRLSR